MKLTPWLCSIKNGIARAFKQAKVKRRRIAVGEQLLANGGGAEQLEDRTVLNAQYYMTDHQDGVYDSGHLLQPQPNPPIDLQLDPIGNPAIPIRVYFNGLVNVSGSVPNGNHPFVTRLSVNTAGVTGFAYYFGGDVSNAPFLTFWYEVENGENTPGPLVGVQDLHITGGDLFGNTKITDGGAAQNIVNLDVLADSGTGFGNPAQSDPGAIIDQQSFLSRGVVVKKHIFIDTKPIVLDVTSTTANSTPYGGVTNGPRPYRVGDAPIYIQVRYSEAVTVAGTPTLALATDGHFGLDGTDARAVYYSGSGTNVLTFEYIIRPGDNTFDLDIAANNALNLPVGAALHDQDFVPDDALNGMNGPTLNGLVPGTLGFNKNIQVDTLAPLVGKRPDQPDGAAFTGITSLVSNGTYGAGQVITIRMTFNEDVLLTGTPSLILATGPNNREATYAGFAGTDTLLFTYVVQLGDASLDLDYVNANALKLNGGTLTDKAGNAASLVLPIPGQPGSLSFNKDLVIDTDVAVTNVTTPLPNGNYGIGQVIPIQVFFNKPVIVTGSSLPQLLLKLDSPTNSVVVDYTSGSGTNILTFNYIIQPGHSSADLDYISANALLLNGATIVDTVGNSNAILTLPLPGSAGSLGNNKNITIDTVLPYIRTVSAPSNFPDGTYSVGQTIPITVTFSEPVSVTGTPRITLETNGIPGVQTLANVGPGQRPDAVVDYVSGGGTTTLTFLYTVGVGDNSPDLDALILTLSNGALIRDFAQNNLQGGVPNFGSLDFPLPQGGSAELLLSVQNTANVPGVAQITDFSVSNTVIVEGERYSFIINANGFNYQISYFAQKDDTAMIVGQFLRQQIGSFMGVTAASFNNGRGIRLTATNPGVPFTVSSLIVTPVSPAPVASGSFTTPVITRANGLPTTQVATITVNQQGPGLIYDLTINGTTLTYQASGTDTLTTVATALRALIAGNVAASNVVSVSGSGTDIVLTAVTSGTPFVLSVSHSLAMNRALVVDTAPIVTNVTTTTADGIYAVGDAPIDISVTFSEPVHVNPGPGGALPTLILATGGTNAIATYVSGSNTNTLVFRYTIAPGETTVDLDYASTGSLLLNGATIQDLDASPADLNAVLPAPGTTGSLSFNKTIGINSLFNDPPVIIAPTSQTIIEDVVGGLVFSAANGNQIQLADVDAGPGNVLLDITAYNGILTFATTFGLTFQNSTANGSSHIVLQGSLSALNQALQGLKYTPAANANSLNAPNARIVIVVDDQGNAGTPQLPAVTSSTKTIPITITPVNDLPVASDKTVTTGSGTPITIILESIDVDGGAPSYSLDPLLAISLRTQHGTLTPIFGGNSLTYTPDPGFVGVDNFIFTVNDGFGNSAIAGNITINVVPVVSTVGFPDVSFPEGNVTNAFPLTVTLNQTFAQDVTITYTTVNGTAVAGTDYEFQTGTVTIPAGQLTGTISINVTGNNLDEPNKTFSVVLSNPVNAVLQDTTAVVTIQNDDGLSIDDVNQFETDSGDTVFTFTVTLSSPQAQTVTVNYATSDGTASRLSDYASAAGILTFLPGQTSKTISITVHGDTTNEGNETFFVDLSNAVGGSSLGKTRGVGTILNDDEKPLYSIGDAQVSEGNAGTKVLSFVVNLSAPSGQTVTVNYSTADLTAGPNSATAGSDYQTKTGILTFLPGQTSQTITITIFGDQAIEENESFLVNLTGGVNADPAITTATGTIVNDDGVYTSNMEIFEGNNGITYMVFTVNAPVGSQNLIVNYSTSAGTATAGVDYTDVSGQLVFTGGVTSRTISVPILGDYAAELDETFFLQLSYAQPGPNQPPLITPIVVGTIKNDDQLRTITSSDVTIVEGNSGTKNAVFTLTLSAPIGVPVTIDYTTVPGTATAGSDYVTTFGTATFQPNQTVVTISVPVIGDLVNEDDETFTLQLSNPTFATFLGNNPVATITDTDNPPSVIFNGLTLNEGQVGSTQATLTVNLSSASGKEVTMGYRTIDGTAVSTGIGIGESDFNAQQGTLTFQPGETSQTITITINGDATYELFENFVVELFNIVNATSNTSTIQRTVTIENDDPVPTVFINDVPQDEGDAVTPFVFTLTLLAPSAVPVTVNYATGSFTAQSGSDFDAATGTVTFNPGETTKTITVNVKGDLNVESDEEFYVNLSPGANVNIGRTAGKGTILNDDFPPTFSIQNVSINEGDSGPTIIEFVVKRTGSLTFPSSVNYSTSNGTATAGLDYLAKNGTVSFGANIDEVKIQILVTGDLTVEPDEIFFVNLTNPVNGTIPVGQGQAQGTIRNDDNAPPVVSMPTVALSVNEDANLTITGISVSDPDAGAASIAVTLSAAHGTLVIRTDAANGLGVGDIANNGTNQVTLTGSIAQINATLASLSGVIYRGYTDYSGSDSLTVLANDLGHSAGANVPKTDTKIVGINVINVNDAPVITYTGSGNSNPAPIASTKGATVAAFGSPNTLTVTDPDNQNFNGGTITVSNLSQISSKDKLAIRNQGKTAGLIGLKGKNITYGGVVIGTFSGGTKGAPLVITLNGSATVAATTALLKNITFGTPKAKVSPTPRTLSVTLSDGKGATSTPVTTVINVTL